MMKKKKHETKEQKDKNSRKEHRRKHIHRLRKLCGGQGDQSGQHVKQTPAIQECLNEKIGGEFRKEILGVPVMFKGERKICFSKEHFHCEDPFLIHEKCKAIFSTDVF